MRNDFTPEFSWILGGGVMTSLALAGWFALSATSAVSTPLPTQFLSQWVTGAGGAGVAVALFMAGAFVMRRIDRRRQTLLEGTLQTRTAALADERAMSEILLENSRDAFLVWNAEDLSLLATLPDCRCQRDSLGHHVHWSLLREGGIIRQRAARRRCCWLHCWRRLLSQNH